jgi:hypothetical protein
VIAAQDRHLAEKIAGTPNAEDSFFVLFPEAILN